MFTLGGGGANNEEFRDTSGGAPSGFAAHETFVLTGLEGASEIKNVVSPTGAPTLENTGDDAGTATQHAEHVGTLRTPHLDRRSICMEKCRCTAEEFDPIARSRSRLALSDACVVSRLSRCRAGAAITGVGTLPMRTVSRQAYGSKCPSVNPNVFNIGHTAPVDQRLPLAETFCGILYRVKTRRSRRRPWPHGERIRSPVSSAPAQAGFP
jgi:hypothetical protein